MGERDVLAECGIRRKMNGCRQIEGLRKPLWEWLRELPTAVFANDQYRRSIRGGDPIGLDAVQASVDPSIPNLAIGVEFYADVVVIGPIEMANNGC